MREKRTERKRMIVAPVVIFMKKYGELDQEDAMEMMRVSQI